MSLPVRTTPEADAQIREIDGWWRKKRHASPDLFADELAASFDIIGHAPNACIDIPLYQVRVGFCSKAVAITFTTACEEIFEPDDGIDVPVVGRLVEEKETRLPDERTREPRVIFFEMMRMPFGHDLEDRPVG